MARIQNFNRFDTIKVSTIIAYICNRHFLIWQKRYFAEIL